ncbi:hypothetical protein [Lysobacter capsici]|uniref:hypothetical protein n=1 Tax=Lysobacter capsici TaxID=435897 RepID=UPI0011DF4F9F|nr:hypothetical protein [Lysobacter capsici]
MKVFASILICLALSGCFSKKVKSTPPDLEDASATVEIRKSEDPRLTAYELSELDRKKLEAKLTEVLEFCQPRLSGFELESKKQAKRAFWLSMSGLIAGSVIGPALAAANASANSAWIAGLSGWGGATNFAAQNLQTSGLSGATIADTRNTIIRNVGEQIKIATNGERTFEERKNALLQARAECILYQIAVPAAQSHKK